MSRAVRLRYGGSLIEGRLTLRGGDAALEADGVRLEAQVSREEHGPWTELRIGGRAIRVAVAKDARSLWTSVEGRVYRFEVVHRQADARAEGTPSGEVLAPMTGKVVAVLARPGASVRDGDLLLTIEAMKMEFKVTAPAAGRVTEVACAAGDRVELGQLLARIEEAA